MANRIRCRASGQRRGEYRLHCFALLAEIRMRLRLTLLMSGCLALQVLGAARVAWPQMVENVERIRPPAEVAGRQPASIGQFTSAESYRATGADPYSETKIGLSLLKNIALDQANLWTSPRRLRVADANWFIPLAAATAASLAVDAPVSKA